MQAHFVFTEFKATTETCSESVQIWYEPSYAAAYLLTSWLSNTSCFTIIFICITLGSHLQRSYNCPAEFLIFLIQQDTDFFSQSFYRLLLPNLTIC